jgi:hypothetical protein
MKNLNDAELSSPDRRRFFARSSSAVAVSAVTLGSAGALLGYGQAVAGKSVSPGARSISPEVKLVDDYNAWFIGGGYEGDMDKLRAGLPAYITNETVLHEPISLPWGGTMIGYDGWVRLCEIANPIFGKIADQMEVSPPNYYQSGKVVLHELTLTLKPKNPDVKPLVLPIIEKYTIENGRIKQIDEFWSDTATLLKQLAAMGAITPSQS